MLQQIEKLELKARKELEGVTSLNELESWRVRYLGRKGELTLILRGLVKLPPQERKTVGARANQVKDNLEAGLRQEEQTIREAQLVSAKKEAIDITLPGRHFPIGRLHPLVKPSTKYVISSYPWVFRW